jgi:hypothetical protein
VTARTDYATSVAAAEATKLASRASAITTHQVTIDAALSVVGYNHQTGNNATLRAAVASANAAKLEAVQNAEKAKQASIEAARITLRDTGDRSAV